jgi:large subunit ribosomal protein L35
MRKNLCAITKGGLRLSASRTPMHSMVQYCGFVTHLRMQRAVGSVRTRRDTIQVGTLGAVRHTTGGNWKFFKTKQAAAKRFIVTGKGKLKRGRCGMRHNTGHRTSKVKRMLGCKTHLSGAQAKKMGRLLMTSK